MSAQNGKCGGHYNTRRGEIRRCEREYGHAGNCAKYGDESHHRIWWWPLCRFIDGAYEIKDEGNEIDFEYSYAQQDARGTKEASCSRCRLLLVVANANGFELPVATSSAEIVNRLRNFKNKMSLAIK